ncbi:MAG: hypothetical protein Q9174_002999 [Haloplaca sp. 1 TL-2023]
MATAFTAHALNERSETTADPPTTPKMQQNYPSPFYTDEENFMIEGAGDSMSDMTESEEDNAPSAPSHDFVAQLNAAATADDVVKVEDGADGIVKLEDGTDDIVKVEEVTDVESKTHSEDSLFLPEMSDGEYESFLKKKRSETHSPDPNLPPTPSTTPNTSRVYRRKSTNITNPMLSRKRGLRPTRGVLPTPATTPSLSRKRVHFDNHNADIDDEDDGDSSPTPGANKRARKSTSSIRPSDAEKTTVEPIAFRVSLAKALAKSNHVTSSESKLITDAIKPDISSSYAHHNSSASSSAATSSPGLAAMKKLKGLRRTLAWIRLKRSRLPPPKLLVVSTLEMVRIHESMWEQMDWEKVNRHVAGNRGAKFYERFVSRMIDDWMEALEIVEQMDPPMEPGEVQIAYDMYDAKRAGGGLSEGV